MKDHAEFLNYVKDYANKNPEVSPYVTLFVAEGLSASRQEALERASDMEAALAFAVSKHLKNHDVFIIGKLKE